jgi:hypothetical protein
MKNYNKILKSLTFVCLAIFFVQCSDNDDTIQKTTIPLFTASDLSLIHNDSEQSWQITEVINKYYDPNYELEITLDCLIDDRYIFSATEEFVQIELGELLCFEDINNGIFTSDHEVFESRLAFMDASQGATIYLSLARGYVNEDQTAMSSTSTWYALAELTENRMVFQKGGQYVGEYDQALVFELIE